MATPINNTMMDGLKRSANIFVVAMRKKLSNSGIGGYPQVISNAIYIEPPVSKGNGTYSITIGIDLEKAPKIRKLFEIYATGEHNLISLANWCKERGLEGNLSKEISTSNIQKILQNVFYIGLMKYKGEIFEGKHNPLISKKLFDKVQEVLKQRGRPRHKSTIEPQVFCGLLRCGTCGMMITGEYRVKKQKNGNEHYYTYYHCTKKRKGFKCLEPCIRQEKLDEQISSLLQKVSLRPDWAEKLNTRLEKDKTKSAQFVSAFVQEAGEKIKVIQTKLQRLLDGYLEQDIDREIYRVEKAKLLYEKKSLDEQNIKLEQKQNDWLEPMENWIKVASNLEKIARDNNLFAKKVIAEQVFGSNLRLAAREARGNPQNQWAALCAAHEMVGQKSESQILEYLYDFARTYFIKNS
jgi:hypothetical protein